MINDEPEHTVSIPCLFSADSLKSVSPETAKSMILFSDATQHGEQILREYHKFIDASLKDTAGDMDDIKNSARLVFTSSWAKAVMLSRGVIDGVNSSNLMAAFLCLRAFVEMAATLRYTIDEIRPIVERCVKAGSVSREDRDRLLWRFNILLHGGRFDWETYFSKGALAVLEKKNRKREKEERKTYESKNLRVGECIKHAAKEEPAVEFIYDYLCDLVHPNKGSNLVLIQQINGKSVLNVGENGPMGILIFERIFPYVISFCHKTMGEVMLIVAVLGADDKQLSEFNR